jgi:hypothetical protein
MHTQIPLHMAPEAGPPTWTADIWLRMRRHFLLKAVGTTVFTWLFFIGYFHLLRNPAFPVAVMPLTALDHLIAFQPYTLAAYLSLWVYVGFAPGLQLTFKELLVYGLWIGGLCLTGLGIFYFWPTQIPPLTIDVSATLASRCCRAWTRPATPARRCMWRWPSSPRCGCTTCCAEARTPAVLYWINWLWFAAIAYSTLAVKQHVVLDALAGALLGMAFALPSLRWRPGHAGKPAGTPGTR